MAIQRSPIPNTGRVFPSRFREDAVPSSLHVLWRDVSELASRYGATDDVVDRVRRHMILVHVKRGIGID